MSLPNVQVLHDRFADDPQVSVLAVHYDERADICGHMSEHEFTFRVIPDGSEVWKRLDVIRFPTLMVIAPDGRVIYNRPSRMTDEIRDEIEQIALGARLGTGP